MTITTRQTGKVQQKVYSKRLHPRPQLINNTRDLNQPIKPVKQEEDPTEITTTPAVPPEVEGPPSSCL